MYHLKTDNHQYRHIYQFDYRMVFGVDIYILVDTKMVQARDYQTATILLWRDDRLIDVGEERGMDRVYQLPSNQPSELGNNRDAVIGLRGHVVYYMGVSVNYPIFV